MMMTRRCELCPDTKNAHGQYQQGDTVVCDQCFSMVDDMVCLCCNGTRPCADTMLLMSCPCYDDMIDEIDEIDECESDDDHMDEPWPDDAYE